MIIRSSQPGVNALRHVAARRFFSSIPRHSRIASSTTIAPLRSRNSPSQRSRLAPTLPSPHLSQLQSRPYSNPSRPQSPTADALLTTLTELYSTAKDEFEIAAEETTKKSVYAADDRAAAHDALDELKEAYEGAVKGEHGKEVERRVGSRIRELESALRNVDELAMED